MKKSIVLLVVNIKKTFYSKCGSKNEQIFKEEELIKMLKIFGLTDNIEQY